MVSYDIRFRERCSVQNKENGPQYWALCTPYTSCDGDKEELLTELVIFIVILFKCFSFKPKLIKINCALVQLCYTPQWWAWRPSRAIKTKRLIPNHKSQPTFHFPQWFSSFVLFFLWSWGLWQVHSLFWCIHYCSFLHSGGLFCKSLGPVKVYL